MEIPRDGDVIEPGHRQLIRYCQTAFSGEDESTNRHLVCRTDESSNLGVRLNKVLRSIATTVAAGNAVPDVKNTAGTLDDRAKSMDPLECRFHVRRTSEDAHIPMTEVNEMSRQTLRTRVVIDQDVADVEIRTPNRNDATTAVLERPDPRHHAADVAFI